MTGTGFTVTPAKTLTPGDGDGYTFLPPDIRFYPTPTDRK